MRPRRRLMTHPRLLGRGPALLTFVMLASFAFAAAGAPNDGLAPIPPLASAVTDQTGTLSTSERPALEAKLRDWEARTANQLAVLIVPTTAPEPIEQYCSASPRPGKSARRARTMARYCWSPRTTSASGSKSATASGRVDRRHVAPDHRRKHRAGIQQGQFRRRHQRRRRRDHRGCRCREPLPTLTPQRRTAPPRISISARC